METRSPTREDGKRVGERLDSLVGSMIYHCAQGEVDVETLGQRFHEVIGPAVTAQAIQEVARRALTEMPSSGAVTDFRDEVAERCAMEKMQQYITLMRDLSLWWPASGEAKDQTLGDLVKAWAAWTGQEAIDLLGKLEPKLLPLVRKWQDRTGCLGAEDRAVFEHRQEAAEFMISLVSLLIAETPAADLADAARSTIQAVVDTPATDLDTGLQGVLGRSCQFVAWRANRQLSAALQANPQDRAALSATEVAALVEYEERKQGWGGDADKAVELLSQSLASELGDQTQGRGTRTVLQNTLESAVRRSLRQNLSDAVRGRLRGRLVRIALGWLRKGDADVATQWEFGESPMTKENANGIRRWLFRR